MVARSRPSCQGPCHRLAVWVLVSETGFCGFRDPGASFLVKAVALAWELFAGSRGAAAQGLHLCIAPLCVGKDFKKLLTK